MKDIHIPPAALEAGARAIQDMRYATHLYGSDDIARVAFLAMVEAWEGMIEAKRGSSMSLRPQIILPLAAPSGAITENPDDKA